MKIKWRNNSAFVGDTRIFSIYNFENQTTVNFNFLYETNNIDIDELKNILNDTIEYFENRVKHENNN